MRVAPKLMPSILLCWPTTSEADVGDMAVEVEPSHQYSVKFCCCATDDSRGQSNKMVSDMEVHMKQRCVIEFFHVEKFAPNDIHRSLLNVYGDQTVDVSTVRQWVACFSSGDSDVKEKPHSRRPCTAVTPQNEERLDQLIRTNWQITSRELYTELNISFNAMETMWQSWNIAKFVLDGSHECSHRNIKNTVCKFVGTY